MIDIAAAGHLRDPKVLDQQVHRMLADPRARSLATNFAGQWLNVRGLELVNPDTNLFPDYTDDLIPAFREELYDFVWDVFGNDRSVQELLTSEYSFLNERLAMHYGVRGVRGRRIPQGAHGAARASRPAGQGRSVDGHVLRKSNFSGGSRRLRAGAHHGYRHRPRHLLGSQRSRRVRKAGNNLPCARAWRPIARSSLAAPAMA